MNDNVISFDIETIPQIKPLSDPQREEREKKYNQVLKRKFPNGNHTSEDAEKIRNLVMAVSPFLGEIITIGLYHVPANGPEEEVVLVGSEAEILTRFWDILKNFKKGVFVSFNGLEFDVPFIIKRSMYHGIEPTNNNFIDLKRFSRWPHFDVKLVMGDFDRFATGNLDLMSDFLGIPSPKEGVIKADGVYQAYLDGKIQEIADYCLRDVIATYKVYNVVKNYTYKHPSKY